MWKMTDDNRLYTMCTEQIGSDGRLLSGVQLVDDMNLSQDISYPD
jgi:hypothetical protein